MGTNHFIFIQELPPEQNIETQGTFDYSRLNLYKNTVVKHLFPKYTETRKSLHCDMFNPQ